MTDPSTIKTTQRTAFQVDSASSPRASAATAELGYDGIELVVGPLQDAEQVTAVFAKIPTDCPPIVATSATCQPTAPNLDTAAPAIIATLAAAAKLGATCLNLTLPPIQSADAPHGFPSYQAAINFLHQLLGATRFEAERSGVALAIEVASGGCFLSPVEMRDLVDTANTWAVGVCLDTKRVATIAKPADWIRTLTHRLHAVRITCDSGDDSQLFQEIGATLIETRFDRTICIRSNAVCAPFVKRRGQAF
jgi:sugar phosphate isomerase/epimerase